MKRTLTGMPAYNKLLSAIVPERTETYTPIPHTSIINQVRMEFSKAGFRITKESYRATDNGDVVVGTYGIAYKDDPDIQLSASFMNSYNKQYRFRFSLGAIVKVSDNGMISEHSGLGLFKRKHKGMADILAEGKIREYIESAGEYWDVMVTHKDVMKDLCLSNEFRNQVIGEMFMNDVLNTLQLNIMRREIRTPSFDYKVDPVSAWQFYNAITFSLKESHPSDWMDDHQKVHKIFTEHLVRKFPEIAEDICIDEPAGKTTKRKGQKETVMF